MNFCLVCGFSFFFIYLFLNINWEVSCCCCVKYKNNIYQIYIKHEHTLWVVHFFSMIQCYLYVCDVSWLCFVCVVQYSIGGGSGGMIEWYMSWNLFQPHFDMFYFVGHFSLVESQKLQNNTKNWRTNTHTRHIV